jgi:preprotein translocase subunit YajC
MSNQSPIVSLASLPAPAPREASAWQALEAPPQTAPKGAGEGPSGPFGSSWFPLVMIAAIFWFVVIGPERKNRKKREQMLAALKKGDKVLTNSGLYGSVAAIQDQVVTLAVADGVRLRFARSAIQTVLGDEPAKDAGKEPKEPKEAKEKEAAT